MTGVDTLIAQGVADPDRLGVMGASYGGYMTNWIVTQTDPLQGRVGRREPHRSHRHVLPLRRRRLHGRVLQAAVGERDVVRRALTADVRERTSRRRCSFSTASAIRACRSPNAWKFYRALKAMGKTVELDIHPRGGHVLNEPMQEREADAAQSRVVHEVAGVRCAQPASDRPFVIEFPRGFDTAIVFLSTA